MKTDYYKLLNISRDASEVEIKRAYRRLALKYHPDQNYGSKEAEQKFKEITEAYEILGDTEKKSKYDAFGIFDVKGNERTGYSDFRTWHAYEDKADFFRPRGMGCRKRQKFKGCRSSDFSCQKES